MPVIPDSVSISDIIKNDVDSYVNHAKCYKRQYNLIIEVKRRENIK